MTGYEGMWGISGLGGLRRLVGGVNWVILFDGFLGVFACVVPSVIDLSSHSSILTK